MNYYHTEVRWLSRGNVLKRLFALRNEITSFLEMKNRAVSLLADATFQCNLAFLSDITHHLNEALRKKTNYHTDV